MVGAYGDGWWAYGGPMVVVGLWWWWWAYGGSGGPMVVVGLWWWWWAYGGGYGGGGCSYGGGMQRLRDRSMHPRGRLLSSLAPK